MREPALFARASTNGGHTASVCTRNIEYIYTTINKDSFKLKSSLEAGWVSAAALTVVGAKLRFDLAVVHHAGAERTDGDWR